MAWLPHCVTPSLEPHIRPHDAHQPTTQSVIKRCLWWLVSVLYQGRIYSGTRISTGYPSTTPVGLALGPDSPRADKPAPGTLGHPAEEILTPLSLLMPAFSLARTPRPAHAAASTHTRCSPTHHAKRRGAAASAVRLDPLHYRRGTTRPVSYYALFQGWLLLSQPLGCLCGPTSFPTERTLRGLSRRSGLFPSRP